MELWKEEEDQKQISFLNIGDNVCVNWRAAGAEKLCHSGHFPIQWLQENHYTNERKSKPQPLVAVSRASACITEVSVKVFLQLILWYI